MTEALKNLDRTQVDLVDEVSRLVSKITGVQLGERQSHMVLNRVKKRLFHLGLNSEREYATYLQNNRAEESKALVSLLTTHHTYFFREFSQFEFLEKTALPKIIEAKRAAGDKTIRIWSAACSRGQEVYSLAMHVNHVLSKTAPGLTFEILGSDVDPESVKIADNGVYLHKEIQEVPMHFLAGNWAKGTGEIAEFAKVKKVLKDRCKFTVINLLDLTKHHPSKKFDIIFCRNVFIYFSPAQIKLISQEFLKMLDKDGYFFIGISENLNGLGLPTSSAGASIYQHAAKHLTVLNSEKATLTAPIVQPKKPLRVLCVDDSPTILALLKKILTVEHGFEVVNTAIHGLDAAKKIHDQAFDIMTLDIHMPEQNGLEYLKSQKNATHPPVVMISSVSRDDADLAFSCLEAGATDYIEKPALSNLSERADEIRTKLKYAVEFSSKKNLHFEQSFAKGEGTISQVDKKLRVISANLSDRNRVASCLKSLPLGQPATVIVVEGAGGGLSSLVTFLNKEVKNIRSDLLEDFVPSSLKSNSFYVVDAKNFYPKIAALTNLDQISVMIFGTISKNAAMVFAKIPNAQFLVEDSPVAQEIGPLLQARLIPLTSFSYHSQEFFVRGKK